MPIIAIVGNKGGAGKTTLSVNLAAGISNQSSIAVIDADPQGSSLQWRAIAGDNVHFPVYAPTFSLKQQAQSYSGKNDVVLIDCPPSVKSPQSVSVLEFADIAIIPVQPSPMDLWATVHIEKAIAEARETNPELKALLVINQLESRTTLSKLVREVLNEIALPVADTAIRRRAIYRNSALEGKSVFGIGKRGADAVEEINSLIQEVV
ncbi:MAG: ParA family protein [Gammaproteobacteria bacterium]|nr:ParA family protein [Gammaproteobacteria bacterium]MBT8134342.1 ParA family protein [Gammaproteobacteria bacterium]NNJ51417.1 ParA family protein [Gammaproteobacteria bacterium]